SIGGKGSASAEYGRAQSMLNPGWLERPGTQAAPNLRTPFRRRNPGGSMVHFIMQYSQMLVAPDHNQYVVRVYAATRSEGHWDGWFVFFPLHGGRELASDRETTQNSFAAVSYWATGISTTYLEGAFQRARNLLPEVRLARRAQDAEREEELARAEAAAYAQAAADARLEAHEAARHRRDAEKELIAERAVAARMAVDLHERAAAAARAEAREAERQRRRHAERRSGTERRYMSGAGGRNAPAA